MLNAESALVATLVVFFGVFCSPTYPVLYRFIVESHPPKLNAFSYVELLVVKMLALVWMTSFPAALLYISVGALHDFFAYGFNFSNWLWASTLFWMVVIWALAELAARSRNAATEYRTRGEF